MKRHILYLAISLFLSLNSFAQHPAKAGNSDFVNDGPYIFNFNNKLVAKWVEDNVLHIKKVNPETYVEIRKKFGLLSEYKDLTNTYLLKPEYKQTYTGADSIAAITDIHGEYDKYISLLKSLGIIDDKLNWKFGTGHLVVLGDSFDRGDKVTELLWHLFGLEKQAEKAGGMVHLLLGNHENMMFNDDLRYMNQKYQRVELITEMKYTELYAGNSVIGKWLRNQPAVISINDVVFVHGGLSIEMVRRKLKIEHINHVFSDMLLGKKIESGDEIEELIFLNDDNGPIWYRGFFNDETFCVSRLDSILDFYSTKHIVVGHTPSNQIKTRFDNRIIGIDAGLGNDQPGAMLVYKNGVFYTGSASCKRTKL